VILEILASKTTGTNVSSGTGRMLQHRCAGRHFTLIHQVAALKFSVKWRHAHRLKSVMSNRKSRLCQSMHIYWRTMLPDFIPIRFETMET